MATDTEPQAADEPVDVNADLKAELESKREHLAEVKNERYGVYEEQQAKLEREQLQAESDRLDAEIAEAEAATEQAKNPVNTQEVHRQMVEGDKEETVAEKRARLRAEREAAREATSNDQKVS